MDVNDTRSVDREDPRVASSSTSPPALDPSKPLSASASASSIDSSSSQSASTTPATATINSHNTSSTSSDTTAAVQTVHYDVNSAVPATITSLKDAELLTAPETPSKQIARDRWINLVKKVTPKNNPGYPQPHPTIAKSHKSRSVAPKEKLWMSDDGRNMHARHYGDVNVADVLAIAFNVFAEKSRDKIITQVLIVKRASSLEFSVWVSWVRIVFGLLPLFLLVSMVFGPLSTAAATFLILKYSDSISRLIQERFNIPASHIIYWFNVTAGIAMFAFPCIWMAILISGPIATAAAVVIAATLYMQCTRNPDTFLQWRLHDYPTPKPTYPIEVYYDQEEMVSMLTFRNKVFAHHRDRVALVSTGSYLVEAFCSMIMPSPMYNSPRMRRLLNYFLGYFMPVIFALKFALYLYPLTLHSWLSYFWKDTIIGAVGILGSFLLSILHRVLMVLYGIVGGDQGPLSFLAHVADSFTYVFMYFSSSLGFALRIDEGLTYFRTKMREFMALASPLVELLSRAFQASVSGPLRIFVDFVTRTTSANASLANAWNKKRMLQQMISGVPATPISRGDASMTTPTTLRTPDTPVSSFRAPESPTVHKKPASRLRVVETVSSPLPGSSNDENL